MKCEVCGNEHDGSYGSGRFCSNHCRHVYIGKQTKTHKCNFNVHRKTSGMTWTCTICGETFSTRSKMQSHRKSIHGFVKGMAWNKGLTKETSSKVREIAEKNKVSMIGVSHPMPKEAREKLSIIRSKILERENSGGFKDVKWYHVSNLSGNDYVVRGTWELTIAELLNEHGILWMKNKRLPYVREGVRRTYNPDFYLPDTNEYIEVKGYYSEKDKVKMRLVLEQHEGVKIYMIGSKEFPMFKEKKLWLNDKLLLQNV